MNQVRALLVLLACCGAGAGPPAGSRFSILGDRTGGANQQIYSQIWRELDQLHPDFVINVGDTIEGGDESRAAREWADLRDFWRQFERYRQYFTPGNHDIWSKTSENLYRRYTGYETSYSFDAGTAHFTVLDNSRTDSLSDNQLRFLEQDLAAHKERRPKFVFFHKPFWVVFLKLGSGEFELHRIARQYGVCCVISGHIHQLIRMERDGILYLAVGSSGASLVRGTSRGEGVEQGWFYQHVLAEVRDHSVAFRVKQVGGSSLPLIEVKQ
jgi:predicted phosphodiesterase